MTQNRFGLQPIFSKEAWFQIISGSAGCIVYNTLWILHKYCSSPQMGAGSKYPEQNTDFILKFYFQPQHIYFIRLNKHSKDFTSMETKYFWPDSDMQQCSRSCLGIVDFITWEQPWNRFLTLSVLSLHRWPSYIAWANTNTVFLVFEYK